jgi:hypothetical protein
MSFVLAYSFSAVGVVLADTRLNATFRDGETVVWERQYRKVAHLPKGFCACAGEAITGRKVLDALSKAPQMSMLERALLVSSESRRVVPYLPESQMTSYQRSRSSIMLLDLSDEAVHLSTIDLNGNIQHQDVNYAVYWPPEISSQTLQMLNKRVENVSCPQSLPQLWAFILNSLKLFQLVQQKAHTVSKSFEVCVLVLQPNRLVKFYGFGDCDKVISKGISGVELMLNEIIG